MASLSSRKVDGEEIIDGEPAAFERESNRWRFCCLAKRITREGEEDGENVDNGKDTLVDRWGCDDDNSDTEAVGGKVGELMGLYGKPGRQGYQASRVPGVQRFQSKPTFS